MDLNLRFFSQVQVGHSWQWGKVRVRVWKWGSPGLAWTTPRGLEPQEGASGRKWKSCWVRWGAHRD